MPESRPRITVEAVIRAAWENYADEYVAGKTVSEIERQSGISRNVINRLFKQAGVFVPNRPSGARRKDECDRGHDMAEHGRLISPSSTWRFCSECKRERQRVSDKKVES